MPSIREKFVVCRYQNSTMGTGSIGQKDITIIISIIIIIIINKLILTFLQRSATPICVLP